MYTSIRETGLIGVYRSFQPVQVPGEIASKAGTTIIESGVLGALLIVSVLANIALVYVVIKTQNRRVEDQREISKVSEKMVRTFSEFSSTLEDLDESQKAQVNSIQGLAQTLNTILMAIMSRQGHGSQVGGPKHHHSSDDEDDSSGDPR